MFGFLKKAVVKQEKPKDSPAVTPSVAKTPMKAKRKYVFKQVTPVDALKENIEILLDKYDSLDNRISNEKQDVKRRINTLSDAVTKLELDNRKLHSNLHDLTLNLESMADFLRSTAQYKEQYERFNGPIPVAAKKAKPVAVKKLTNKGK
jgi:chromosome segregation ATPase